MVHHRPVPASRVTCAPVTPGARSQPADPTGAPRLVEDPHLARLPTEEEIAARLPTGLDPAVRRRPIGAVIADICHDFGIAPGHLDRAFWDEISDAIMMYGGSLARFFVNLDRRLFGIRPGGGHADPADPGGPAAPPRMPALATGPP